MPRRQRTGREDQRCYHQRVECDPPWITVTVVPNSSTIVGIATFIRDALTTMMNVVRLTAIAGGQCRTRVCKSVERRELPVEVDPSGSMQRANTLTLNSVWTGSVTESRR